MLPLAMPIETAIATVIAMIAHTEDSSPTAMPASTVVAGPVRAESAISLTGERSVEVKCSVIIDATCPRQTPVKTAQKTSRLWTYHWATQNEAMTVTMPATR